MAQKYTVIWSGGADSTLALTMYASYSSVQTPVKALTIKGHRQLNKWQLRNEKKARNVYLKWAKKQGYHVQHVTAKVEVNSNATSGGQADLWLCHLSPYIEKDETVVFPYIKSDDFWHIKHEFVTAFNALSGLKRVTREIIFPLEWHYKWQIVRDLKEWKVPDDCWWTCDQPNKSKPCGKCLKCKALKEARRQLVVEKKASLKKMVKK